MKVKLKSSYTHPVQGKIYPEGTELEIDAMYFNADYHTEVKKSKPKKDKK